MSLLVPQARFELTTPGLGIRCSILLSYWGIIKTCEFKRSLKALQRLIYISKDKIISPRISGWLQRIIQHQLSEMGIK